MQDRFKFRVWNKTSGDMHYNDFVITATGYAARIFETIDYKMIFNQQDLEFDKHCEIMQCTGLKDKHGKLIFEFDVVMWNGYRHIVQWNDSMCSFILRRIDEDTIEEFYISNGQDLEVIGNIYTNPELLKEQK